MGRFYVLHDDRVAEEPDYAKWLAWHDESYEEVRRVAETTVKYGIVSTVFLAMNATASQGEPPLLFETTVKGGWLGGQRQRYSSLAEARAGHKDWVARIRALEKEHDQPPPDCPVW